MVTNKIFNVTNCPRHDDGESSAMYLCPLQRCAPGSKPAHGQASTYIGTSRLAPPTARPTTLRPTIIPATDEVMACHKAPPMNKMSATKTTRFRPIRSANTPAAGLATRAPKLVQEAMKLISRIVRECPRSLPMETKVEEITPVLKTSQHVTPG